MPLTFPDWFKVSDFTIGDSYTLSGNNEFRKVIEIHDDYVVAQGMDERKHRHMYAWKTAKPVNVHKLRKAKTCQ